MLRLQIKSKFHVFRGKGVRGAPVCRSTPLSLRDTSPIGGDLPNPEIYPLEDTGEVRKATNLLRCSSPFVLQLRRVAPQRCPVWLQFYYCFVFRIYSRLYSLFFRPALILRHTNIGGLFRQTRLYTEPFLNYSTCRLPARRNYRRRVSFFIFAAGSLAVDRNEADYTFDFYKAVPTTNSNISSLSLIEPFEISYIFPVLHTTVFLLCINAQPHSGISTCDTI